MQRMPSSPGTGTDGSVKERPAACRNPVSSTGFYNKSSDQRQHKKEDDQSHCNQLKYQPGNITEEGTGGMLRSMEELSSRKEATGEGTNKGSEDNTPWPEEEAEQQADGCSPYHSLVT